MIVLHIIHLQTEKKVLFTYNFWRGARVVMEQIANLSTGNRCQGSNPCLSAFFLHHNIKERFKRHNNGFVPSTKSGKPWKLHKTIPVKDRTEALKLEKKIKK